MKPLLNVPPGPQQAEQLPEQQWGSHQQYHDQQYEDQHPDAGEFVPVGAESAGKSPLLLGKAHHVHAAERSQLAD